MWDDGRQRTDDGGRQTAYRNREIRPGFAYGYAEARIQDKSESPKYKIQSKIRRAYGASKRGEFRM